HLPLKLCHPPAGYPSRNSLCTATEAGAESGILTICPVPNPSAVIGGAWRNRDLVRSVGCRNSCRSVRWGVPQHRRSAHERLRLIAAPLPTTVDILPVDPR